MKYLVNKETKEHIVFHADVSVPYPQWSIVEADSEGWITWEGGERPLPDDCICDVKVQNGKRLLSHTATTWDWGLDIGPGTITHYRPILATSDTEEPRRYGTTAASAGTQQSVFDRLKSAIAASESIPAIIAEINALLPEGYHVTKRPTHRNV